MHLMLLQTMKGIIIHMTKILQHCYISVIVVKRTTALLQLALNLVSFFLFLNSNHLLPAELLSQKIENISITKYWYMFPL